MKMTTNERQQNIQNWNYLHNHSTLTLKPICKKQFIGEILVEISAQSFEAFVSGTGL